MNKNYSVTITFKAGRKKGQTSMIDGIDPDDIMEILGEIAQEQLANAEIKVNIDGREMICEDFIISFIGKRNAYAI